MINLYNSSRRSGYTSKIIEVANDYKDGIVVIVVDRKATADVIKPLTKSHVHVITIAEHEDSIPSKPKLVLYDNYALKYIAELVTIERYKTEEMFESIATYVEDLDEHIKKNMI